MQTQQDLDTRPMLQNSQSALERALLCRIDVLEDTLRAAATCILTSIELLQQGHPVDVAKMQQLGQTLADINEEKPDA